MSRELQSDLFKEKNKEITPKQSLQTVYEERKNTPDETTRKIKALTDNFEALFRRMETFETRFDQTTKNLVMRADRTMTMISHVQTQINQIANDLNEKVVQLTAKINERRLQESKVEDLVERHGTVVKAFETRMSQLHKMITEQDRHLHSFSSALNEARAEIRRNNSTKV